MQILEASILTCFKIKHAKGWCKCMVSMWVGGGRMMLEGVVYLGCGPLPVTVTTRIITYSVGNLYKPSKMPLLLGGGHTQGIPAWTVLWKGPNTGVKLISNNWRLEPKVMNHGKGLLNPNRNYRHYLVDILALTIGYIPKYGFKGSHVGVTNKPNVYEWRFGSDHVFPPLHFGVIFRPASGFQGCYLCSFEADHDPSFWSTRIHSLVPLFVWKKKTCLLSY